MKRNRSTRPLSSWHHITYGNSSNPTMQHFPSEKFTLVNNSYGFSAAPITVRQINLEIWAITYAQTFHYLAIAKPRPHRDGCYVADF